MNTPEHLSHLISQWKRRKTNEKKGNGGGRGRKKHRRNNICRMLEGKNRLHIWECICIQLQAPADCLAAKQANQHDGTTNMVSHEGNPTRTLQKMLVTLRETQPIMLRHCQVTPGNAGNFMGNTGNANNATPLPSHVGKRTARNARDTQTV